MSETIDLRCVYGAAVMHECPVRLALTEPTLSKYKQSIDPNARQLKEYGEIIAAANNMQWLPMPSFCASCPHLHRYNLEEETKKCGNT